MLLSDNGTEFRNQLLEEICKQFGIKQCFTVSYHPANYGLVERANRKILDVLRPVISGLQHIFIYLFFSWFQEIMPLVLFVLMHSVLAVEPAHLKPGVLSAHLGRVSLVEDDVWVVGTVPIYCFQGHAGQTADDNGSSN